MCHVWEVDVSCGEFFQLNHIKIILPLIRPCKLCKLCKTIL